MSGWLDVATPRGDLAVLERAAQSLDGYADTVMANSYQLAGLGNAIESEWFGDAAAQFHLKNATAGDAVEAIARAQARAAGVIRDYANEWESAKQVCEQGHADINDALDSYAQEARSALQGLANHIEEFLNNPVVETLAAPLVAAARAILDRLYSWQAPSQRAALFVVSNPYFTVPTPESVIDGLQAGVSWGVSHLLDGIGAVAGAIGGLIHGAIDLVHWVEQKLASAIATAQRFVHKALETLFEFGKKAVSWIGHIIAETAKAIFNAAVSAVNTVIGWMIAIGQGIATLIRWGAQVAIVVSALIIVLVRDAVGFRQERRMVNGPAADDAAWQRFYGTDPSYRDHVRELKDLADAAYDPGAPDGWRRVEDYDGEEGFYAVVYERVGSSPPEIVVSFRGTQFGSLTDWNQNALNATDLRTSQGAQAIALAQEMHARYGANLTFTGHSLGGCLASMGSIATGVPTTTFNAASIGAGNYEMAMEAGDGVGGSEAQITNFYTTYDIVTNAQSETGLPPAAGAQVAVTSNTIDVKAAHDPDAYQWPGDPVPAGSSGSW